MIETQAVALLPFYVEHSGGLQQEKDACFAYNQCSMREGNDVKHISVRTAFESEFKNISTQAWSHRHGRINLVGGPETKMSCCALINPHCAMCTVFLCWNITWP